MTHYTSSANRVVPWCRQNPRLSARHRRSARSIGVRLEPDAAEQAALQEIRRLRKEGASLRGIVLDQARHGLAAGISSANR